MEFFAELSTASYYHTNKYFFLDGRIAEITNRADDSLKAFQEGDKVSIKFVPSSPKEFTWLASERIVHFTAIRADNKKFPKNGVTQELVVTEAKKCVLSLAKS